MAGVAARFLNDYSSEGGGVRVVSARYSEKRRELNMPLDREIGYMLLENLEKTLGYIPLENLEKTLNNPYIHWGKKDIGMIKTEIRRRKKENT